MTPFSKSNSTIQKLNFLLTFLVFISTSFMTIASAQTTTFTASDPVNEPIVSSDEYIDLNWTIPASCLVDENGIQFNKVLVQIKKGGSIITSKEYRNIDNLFLDQDFKAISGNFRDIVGPSFTLDYTLELEVQGGNNQVKTICTNISDRGRTTDLQVPINSQVSNDKIDKVNVSWTHRSDWIKSYTIRRSLSNGSNPVDIPTNFPILNKGQSYTFSDAYSFTSDESIKNGEKYSYSLIGLTRNNEETIIRIDGIGETIPIQFNATDSDDATSSNVNLKWNDISNYADEIKIYRDGQIISQFTPNANQGQIVNTSFFDLDNDGVNEEGIAVCSTPNICALEGSVNASKDLLDNTLLIGSSRMTISQQLFGTAIQDEDEITSGQTSGAVGISQGVNKAKGFDNRLVTSYVLSQPVCNLSISVWDLDRTDEMMLKAFNNGIEVDYDVTYLGNCLVQSDNTFRPERVECQTQINRNESNSASVKFNTCIDKIDISYYDQGKGNGGSYTVVFDEGCTLEPLTDLDNDGVIDFLEKLNFLDKDPTYGVSHQYEIRLFRDGKAIVADFDFGKILANGEISGRVITKQDEIPVKGITITATSKNTDESTTTLTNDQGDFIFTNLKYDLLDSIILEAQEFTGHSFSESKLAILSKSNPVSQNNIFFDNFSYRNGFTTIEIENFKLTPRPSTDDVKIDWNVSPKQGNIAIEIIRDGTRIYTSDISNQTTTDHLQTSFFDKTGAPGKEYSYTLKAYQITGDLVTDPSRTRLSTSSKKSSTFFPKVVPVNSLVATPNPDIGYVLLTWIHRSNANDGFRIYRNGSLLAEVPGFEKSYRDELSISGQEATYSITAYRNIDGLTTESAPAESEIVSYPNLAAPQSLMANANTAISAVELSWDASTTDEYNFTGYNVYRTDDSGNEEKLVTIFKGGDLVWTDYNAIPNKAYIYSVKSFLTVPNGDIVESQSISSDQIQFPTLQPPSEFEPSFGFRFGKLASYGFRWKYVESDVSIDGFILYGNDATVVDTVTADKRRHLVYSSDDNFTNKISSSSEFRISAFRIIDGQFFESELATPFRASGSAAATITNVDPNDNFKATTDLHTHIRLSWINETLSSNFIYRDKILIATLASGITTYNDYDVQQGITYEYEIESNLDGDKSIRLASYGSLVNTKTIQGRVFNPSSYIGIPGVSVFASSPSWDENFNNVVAVTDSTGNYFISDFPITGNQTITLTFDHPIISKNNNSTTFTTDGKSSYEVNFLEEFKIPFEANTAATISAFEAIPNPITRHIKLQWNTDTDLYDGIEIRRGTDIIAFIPKGDANFYLDTLVVPGIQYTYLISTYLNENTNENLNQSACINKNDVNTAGTDLYKVLKISAPKLLPTFDFRAFENESSGDIILDWSHQYDNHKYYLISRNDVILDTIPSGERLQYIDNGFSPNEITRYSIVAVEVIDDEEFFSSPVDITINAPGVARVTNVRVIKPSVPFEYKYDPPDALVDGTVAVAPGIFIPGLVDGRPIFQNYTQNHVEIHWDFPKDVRVLSGFNIYKGEELLATVDNDIRSYVDFTGIPLDVTKYFVTTNVNTDKQLTVESERKAGNVQRNYSLDFSGGNADPDGDYIEVPHNNSLNIANNDFTIEAWIRPTGTNHKTIVCKGEGFNLSAIDYILGIWQTDFFPGNGRLGLFLYGKWEFSETAIPINEWTHVAVTFDMDRAGSFLAGEAKFYINGILDATRSYQDNTLLAIGNESAVIYNDQNPLFISRQGYGRNAHNFVGQMDELKIWNKNLSQDQINTSMSFGVRDDENLILRYDFNKETDQASETSIRDRSGNSLDGTLQNFEFQNTSSNWILRDANGQGFPLVSQPIHLSVEPINTEGYINIQFDYPTYGDEVKQINKFNVFRDGIQIDRLLINDSTNNHFEFDDLEGVYEEFYIYGVQAQKTENNNPYTSATSNYWKEVQYPALPAPTNFNGSIQKAFSVIDFTWDYPVRNRIDHFILKDDGVTVRDENNNTLKIDRNSRKHSHIVTNFKPGIGHTYTITAVHDINGVTFEASSAPLNISTGVENTEQTITGNSQTIDQFAWSLEMTSEWLIVGAPLENRTGTVYIYRFSEPALSYVEWKTISGSGIDERFGHAVDIHKNQMIIGAPAFDNSKGRVEIYEFEDGDWILKHEHKARNKDLELGYDVSIENDVAIASMPNWPNLSAAARPSDHSMYTVHKSQEQWEQINLYNNSQFVFPEQHKFTAGFDKREGHSIDYTNNILVYDRLEISGNGIQNSFTMVSYEFNTQTTAWEKLADFKGSGQRDKNPILDYDAGMISWMNTLDINILKNSLNESVYYPTRGERYDFELNRISSAIFDGSWSPKFTHSRIGPSELQPIIDFARREDETVCNRIAGPWNTRISEGFINNEVVSYKAFPSENLPGRSFRKEIDISLTHAVVGSPGVEFPFIDFTSGDNKGRINLVRLNKINDIIKTVNATDGLVETTIDWNLLPGLQGDYIFRIYRDNEFIHEEASRANEYSFIDKIDEGTAIAGKKYVYTVVPIQTGINCSVRNAAEGIQYGKPVSDPGFAKATGEIKGRVITRNGGVGVPNVTVTTTANIDGELFQLSVDSVDPDGSFTFNEIPFAPSGTTFSIKGGLEDLVFSTPDQVILSNDNSKKNGVIIFNESSYIVQGQVNQFEATCGLAGRRVDYYEVYEDKVIKKDSVYTDNEGHYNLIVNPFAEQLKSIRIQIDNIQNYSVTGEDLSPENEGLPATHQFVVTDNDIQGAEAISDAVGLSFDPAVLKTVSTINFTDELLFPVQIDILNSCGSIIDNSSYKIRIISDESCFVREATTNSQGKISIDLPPLNYQFQIIAVADNNPTIIGNKVLEYLKSKPIKLGLQDLHREAADSAPIYDRSVFIYHTKANISLSTSTAFNRFLCEDPTRAAILQQGDRYALSFIVSENHGQACEVNEGYLLIRNSGSADSKPSRINYNKDRNNFPLYRFNAGSPNLISPHEWTILVQYFSESDNLLSEHVIPVLVEGSRQLPGAGLTLDLNGESGEVQLPIMVLRDPPGDASSVTIEKGSRISSELSFNRSASRGGGFLIEGSAAFGGPGFFAEYEFTKGGGDESSNAVIIETEVTESISTSDDNDFVGRAADLIVGVGLATSYGVLQGIRVNDCDDIQLYTDIGFSADGVSTEWNYTVGFIENLIVQLKTDSLKLREGNLTYRYPDGTPYAEDQAILKVGSEISAWNKILEYHDVNSLPHYILCADNSFRESLSDKNRAELDKWRGAFCSEIGNFEDNKFILNDKITWDDDLINKYKNTAAAIESMKIDRDDFPVEFNQDDWDLAERSLTADYEAKVDSLGHNPAKNKTLSGGVLKEYSYTNTRTATTDLGLSAYFNTSGGAGFYFEAEIDAGIGLITDVVNIQGRTGGKGEFESSYGSNRVSEDEQSTAVTVSLLDDDADDNFSVTVIPSPLSNHGPYFALTGGQSSCPAEEALSSRDNAPINIDNFEMVIEDPQTGAIGNTITKNNIPLDEVIKLRLKVKNITNLNLDRVAELFAGNNFENLLIVVENDPLTSTNSPSIPINGSSEKTISISFERNRFSDGFDFEDIRINLKVFCDGEDTRSELESSNFVTVNLHYQQPCSQISLGAPEENFLINRVNNTIPNDRELLSFKLYDLDLDNENLDRVILEYKRLGAESAWTEITRLRPADIKTEYDMFAFDQTPYFLYNWDITGLYNQFPDGDYLVRAISECRGSAGSITSKEIKGMISRSSIHATGTPEPADGIWSTGDEISVSYSSDLDCGLINRPAELAKNFKLLNRSQNDEEIPFDLICKNGKLSLKPQGDLSQLEGETLVAIYLNVIDDNGNRADDIEWSFKVITKQADWISQDIELRLYQGDIINTTAYIANGTGAQVTGLHVAKNGDIPWLEVDTDNFILPKAGNGITLTITGNQPPGIYEGQLMINGVDGSVPAMNIKITILSAPPQTETFQTKDNQMVITADWKFEEETPDVDSLDQIQVWIDGELRGFANMRLEGPFYAATIIVEGNEEDEGKFLEFRVWHGDFQTYYEAKPTSVIRFNKESKVGSLDEPETIIVDIRNTINDVVDNESEKRTGLSSQADSSDSFSLSPNPTSGDVTISLQKHSEGNSQIDIYNSIGEFVLHFDNKDIMLNNHKIIFDTSRLQNGIYNVVHSSADQKQSKKLIVIK